MTRPKTPTRRIASALLLLAAHFPVFTTQGQAQTPDTPTNTTPAAENAGESAGAQPVPEPQPTLIVRDLLVLQADQYGQLANDPAQLRTTLDQPILHRGRAKLIDDADGYTNSPMPLGLISFQGRIDQPMRVRVDLTADNAMVHAHWPNDALTGNRQVHWLSVHTAGPDQRADRIGNGEHWLTAMRGSEDRLWLAMRDPQRKERFLLYDVAVPYLPAMKLEQVDQAYKLVKQAKADQAPPITLLLIRHQDMGWSAQSLQSPWPGEEPQLLAAPADQPGEVDLDKLLSPLTEQLRQRGYNDAEVSLARQMVAAALEKSQMSLVYIMPDGQIDKQVQLRVDPAPDRLTRSAIVVINHVDPDLGTRVRMLIAELGSDNWQTRHRAQKTLESLGKAALKPLQEARGHTDPEIAFRAQQILDAYDRKVEQNR